MKSHSQHVRWQLRESRRAARIESRAVDDLVGMKLSEDFARSMEQQVLAACDMSDASTCTNTFSHSASLTTAQLLTVMEDFQRKFPALPSHKFDIYGSDLVPALVEIGPRGIDEILPDFPKDRRVLICPKGQLHQIARDLTAAGADVRIEPRVREREPKLDDESEVRQ